MHSRWLWNIWYSNSSTLKIRESFRLFLANQCHRTKSFNNSIDNNHPTIFFHQNCSWYKTHLFLAHLLNICYKLSATIVWRPHNLSPHSLVGYYSSFGWCLQVRIPSPQTQLSALGIPDTTSGCLAQQADCFIVALPWLSLCQEVFKSLKWVRKL